jgi:hypothetical protein
MSRSEGHERDVLTLDQGLVHRGGAELVDQHRRTRSLIQQTIQQRGLAAAEKARQNDDGKRGFGA